MSDFDEMRLVFKQADGYVWRCPCGLGAKAPMSSAGKARTGARDHINRRHARMSAQQKEAADTKGRHASGAEADDFAFLADAARHAGLQFQLLSNAQFVERSTSGIPGRYSPGTLEKLSRHYRFVDQVLLLPSETELPPRAWMPLVDALTRRGFAVLYDVPDWNVIGPKAVLVGMTRIPPGPCQAYVNGLRTAAVAPAEGTCLYRPCQNKADHLVVMPEKGAKAKAVRVALCRLHRRTYVSRGYDLSMRGGPEFVDFTEAAPEPLVEFKVTAKPEAKAKKEAKAPAAAAPPPELPAAAPPPVFQRLPPGSALGIGPF